MNDPLPSAQANAARTPETVAKEVIAWGSLSYAFGFFTVTAHTARLGLPVMELIQPVYVWIGLPLAAVAFFWKQFVAFFRERSRAVSSEIRSYLAGLKAQVSSKDLDLVTELFSFASVLPGIDQGLLRAVLGLLRTKLEAAADRFKEEKSELYEQQARRLRRLANLARVYVVIRQVLRLLLYAFLLLGALWLYVWELYPRIPQGFGGGEPTTVRMVIEKASLPPELSVSSAQDELSTTVLPADLLYATEKVYYIELADGTRLGVAATGVKSIVWVRNEDAP